MGRPLSAENLKKTVHWNNPCHLITVGFGSGLSPWMPGTVGTLAALPFWWLFASWGLLGYGMLLLVAFLLGVIVCGRVAAEWEINDPQMVVWDEFVGLWLALWAIPALQWPWIAAGFTLFRWLDIKKPGPIGWVDRHISGGLGIMLDDVIAGGLTALLLKMAGYGWKFYSY